MNWFWVATALVSAAMAALIVARAAGAARRDRDDNPSLAVYRRQMAEIDELADRGLLGEGDRRGARAETGRRLLAAAGHEEAVSTGIRPITIVLAAAIAPLLALVIYLWIGAPGMTDEPFARRLAAWSAAAPDTLDAPRVAAIKRHQAAQEPHNAEPLRDLALAELQAGEPLEAIQALRRATALSPDQPKLWEFLGIMLTVQGQGDVSPEAANAFAKALALDPKSPYARRFMGQARIQSGDVQGGLAEWKGLLADLDPRDPLSAPLSHDIDVVSRTGKLPPPPPASDQPPGVSGADIQGMVDGLAARLAANGDDPQGWVRLVRAYTVLGQTAKRDAALAAARKRYAGNADVLRALDAALKPPS